MTEIIRYDAFTGMNFSKKMSLIDFLCGVNELPETERSNVTKSIDYALKDTVSFGGFIFTFEKKQKFLGAIVVNKSGMGGFLPEHLIVVNGVAPVECQEEIMALLFREANLLTRGDIAIVNKSTKSNEVHLVALADSNVKYLNDSTLRERVLRSIA